LFGQEGVVIEAAEDARLSAALATSLVTGVRVRTDVAAQKGASLGGVAVMTRTDADGGESVALTFSGDDEFSMARCLIGPNAAANLERAPVPETTSVASPAVANGEGTANPVPEQAASYETRVAVRGVAVVFCAVVSVWVGYKILDRRLVAHRD